ncbi:MAG: Fe-S cluster assembly ATPase SufC [Bacilli bacterium]
MDIEIKDLTVKIKDKTVLNKFNLHIKPNEIHVIMGPNGVGKSTLSKVIMGSPTYKVVSGDILVKGKSILNLTTDERARLGLFLSFQNPIGIEGVTNQEFLRMALNSKRETPIGLYEFIKELEKNYNDLKFPKEMMHRGINEDFSGGERKKNEIIQLKTLKPSFLILDELDSGLDIDSLKLVCKNVLSYKKEMNASILLITHYNRILTYLKPDFVHILLEGKIVATGDYSLVEIVEKNGYNAFKNSEYKVSEAVKNE